jgi:alanine dehydrogenase
MTLILDNADVTASIDMPRLIDAIEGGLRLEHEGGVHSVPRINLPGAGSAGFFRVMPVVIPGADLMGLKAFNTSAPGGLRYVIALWSFSSGELLALMDAHYLTAARTGAVTGVATRAMTAERGRDEVGVIGSGLEARTNLEAICAAGGVVSAKVFSPNEERRRRFAAEMTDRLGIQVRVVGSAAEAADAPVVLVATNTGNHSGIVALEGRWLRGEGHVSTIGSTMPALREVDAETFGRADLVVLDTAHARNESGDLQAAEAAGAWDERKVVGLTDIVGGPWPLDGAPALTVFKSVGTALQDIVAAGAVYETARQLGRGRDVEFLEQKFF